MWPLDAITVAIGGKVESYMVVMLLTFILIIVSIPLPHH